MGDFKKVSFNINDYLNGTGEFSGDAHLKSLKEAAAKSGAKLRKMEEDAFFDILTKAPKKP